MAKPNMKSVRLSNEALAIVNDAPGSGFNDKFENLIFAYKKTIPERTNQLTQLKEKIRLKKLELEKLQNLAQTINNSIHTMQNMSNLVIQLDKEIKDVSQKVDQVKTNLTKNEIQNYEQIDLTEYTGNVHEEDYNNDEDLY